MLYWKRYLLLTPQLLPECPSRIYLMDVPSLPSEVMVGHSLEEAPSASCCRKGWVMVMLEASAALPDPGATAWLPPPARGCAGRDRTG